MKNNLLKLLMLSILLIGLSMGSHAAVSITKTPSTNSVRVGQVFEYNITISNISSLSELGKIDDVLDPGLTYLGTDFNTTSTVYGFYAMMCPAQLSQFAVPASGSAGTLVFQFPTDANCNATGYGTLSFKIRVAVSSQACNLNSIPNSVKLFDRPGNQIASASCNVTVDHSNPWTLVKTFREFNSGFLVYDVRLNSTVGEYNTNVFTTADFTDEFTVPSCVTVVQSACEVNYIPNEGDLMNTQIVANNPTLSGGNLNFIWSLPASGSTTTLSSYLFQVKIKIQNCDVNCAPFILHNYATFNGTDICNNPVQLNDTSDIPGVSCLNGSPNIPETPKLCALKTVQLLNNDLNLTMMNCKGKYIIKIDNCTSNYNYIQINFTDIIPSQLTADFTNIVVTPSSYAAGITVLGNTVSFDNSGVALTPGNIITIEIPFTVTTNLPNEVIQNCANLDVTLLNNVTGISENINKLICAANIKTVPNNVEVVRTKKICNPPMHNCGMSFTQITHNLPGDHVDYALHFYNYGTTTGQNVSLTDVLPNNFIINPTTDVKVYKLTTSGNSVADICNPSGFTDITSSVNIMLVGNTLKINLLGNELDAFTCSGITHYIVKVNAVISATAADGSYTNSFSVKYQDPSDNSTQSVFSNAVTSIVNKEGLVFTKKDLVRNVKDCFNKRDTLEYEITLLNLGLQTVYANISDIVNVPFPLTVSNGISNPVYCYSTTGSPCPIYNSLITGGGITVATTTTQLTINNMPIPPCNLLRIRYKIILNTNNVNEGQVYNVCNNAKIEIGYMVRKTIKEINKKPHYSLVTNPELIDRYFTATSSLEQFRIIQLMKAERKAIKPIKPRKFMPGATFIAIDTITVSRCIEVSDCLGGKASSCSPGSGPEGATFKINSIDAQGIFHTTLTIPSGAPQIRKIEYVLADSRMLGPCNSPYSLFCCKKSTLGVFAPALLNYGSIVNLDYVSSWIPGAGMYKEINRVVFSGNPSTITTVNKNFRLTNLNLNCSGNLEVVVTAIVYYENCVICFYSDSKDYHAVYSWPYHEPVR